MARQLDHLNYEDDGFKTLQDAIEFCKGRSGITRAWIGKRERFHVFVAAIEHHRRFYHVVADYVMHPTITYREEADQ
jgi:hypothetical protein